MTTLATEIVIPTAISVHVTDDTLTVELSDGRSISVPTAWYPRLLNGSQAERTKWRLIGSGDGIHWEDLDEDISVESLIAGRSSKEKRESVKKWIDARKAFNKPIKS